MIKINPTKLKSLRIQSGLSHKQLYEKSKVSERQISRIESSDTYYDAREYTAERLARALAVEVNTLADDVTVDPDQLDGTEGNDQIIHPKRLRSLRERRKLSRRELAEKSGVSERQIGRVEASGTDVPVRMNTMIKLASALGVDADMLVDDPTAIDPLPVPPSQDVQLSIKISSQVRLAYDLVKHRYGPSQKDIIKLAPLLYVLLAEGSLVWRRQWLEEAKAAQERLEQLTDERKNLLIEDYQMEESIEAEQESIERSDHIGDTVSARGGWSAIDYASNSFSEYLTKLSKELDLSGIINSWGDDVQNTINSKFGPGINLIERIKQKSRQLERPTRSGFTLKRIFRPESDRYLQDVFFEHLDWGAMNYLICQDELVEISGNSLGALFALVRGDVRVPEIPEELMTERTKDKRVEWIESKMSDETQQMEALYRELFAKDYNYDFRVESQ